MILPAQGICFAIAINTAKLSRGTVDSGGPGPPERHRDRRAEHSALARKVARFYRLPAESGVRVEALESGGPAEAAGLRTGDVIVAFGDTPIGGIDDLQAKLTDREVGVRSPITVLRGVERLVLDIVPRESKTS